MQNNLQTLSRLGLYIFVFAFLIIVSYRIEIISNYLPPLLFFLASVLLSLWLYWLSGRYEINIIDKEIILVFIIIFMISGVLRGTSTLYPELFETNEVNRWD